MCGERDWAASPERATARRVVLIATDWEASGLTRLDDDLRERRLAAGFVERFEAAVELCQG